MAKRKHKEPGRPLGSPNAKNKFERNETFKQMRCSQGFNKTIDEILANGSTKYKSKADVMHAALQLLAARELPATFFFYDKIW